MYLPVFVMNRIPSDLYRVRNPKLEILKSQETGYWYIKSSITNQVSGAPDTVNVPYPVVKGKRPNSKELFI